MPKDRGAFTRERRLPQNINPQGTRCVRFTLPDDDQWEAILLGQLEPLTRWMTWAYDEQKQGTIVAKRWRDIVFTYARCDEDCAAPFWYDSPDEAEDDCDPDDDDTAIWEAADWAVSAFLFVTATPAAALTYKTFAPKIRNFFRAPSVGAICDIVVNGILYASVPTSAATAGVSVGDPIPVSIDIVAHNIAHNIIPFPQPANVKYIHRLPAAGGGEPTPPATLEIIRSRVKPPTLCDDVFDVKPTWQQLAQAWFDCYGDELPMAALRQKPGNPCILQQQTLSGWTDVYDFSLCPPASNNVQNSILYQNIYNEYTNIVNNYTQNGVPGVAPDMTFDNTPEDDFRNVVLCYVAGIYIDLVCEVELERRNQTSIGFTLANIAIAVIAALVAAGTTVFSSGAASPLAVAIVSALIEGLNLAFNGVSDDVLNNAEARQKVACCFYTAVFDKTPTKPLFAAALDNCNFTFGSYEAQLAGAILGLLERDDIFANYLTMLQENYRYAELGLLPECPCETPPFQSWCVEFDFTTSQHGFTILAGGYGTWVSGQGFVGADINESGVYSKRVHIISPTIDSRQILGLDAIMNYTKGSFTAGNNWAIAANIGASETSPDYNAPIRVADTMVTGNDQTIEIDYPDINRTQLRLDTRASRMTTTPPNGAITLKKLRVRGMGEKPSQWAAAVDCGEYCWVWDFLTSQNTPDWAIYRGVYVAGQGVNTIISSDPNPASNAIDDLIFTNLLTIKHVELTFAITKGYYAANTAAAAINLFGDGGLISQNILPQSSVTNGTGKVYAITINTPNVRQVQVLVRSAEGTLANVQANPGLGTITRVKIRYTGTEIWQNGEPC